MNKNLLLYCWLERCFWGRSVQAQESSSIDAVTAGVADTGRADKEAEKKITASTVPYSVAVLPYIDQSGMDEKGRKVAANAIKDALKEKYPPAKKGGVNTVASAKAVAKAMQNHPFENADAPVLAELVAVGELGVDRVIYMEMEPPRNKETGFMVIVGSQTYSSAITMKLKCVDVKTEKYLFNRIVEEVIVGRSFGRSAARARAGQ
ncbi:MAG: hypothetical protein ACLR2G_04950 [Phascolarctobacterium faecium]